MELTLLGTAGLAAFLIGGAGVLIVASFRRTIALREALIQALKRIERLEAQLALDPGARTPIAPASAPVADYIDTAEPPPPRRTIPQPVDALPQQPSAPTFAPAARRGIPAPTANMAMFSAGLAAFAVLMAAQIRLIEGWIGFALAMLIALLAFGCAEWRRQGELADERHSIRMLPPQSSQIALFSFALALMSLVYARNALHAPQAELAFAGAATLAFAAALLWQRFGPWLLGASIIAAAMAPAFLVGSDWAQTGQALFVLIYLAAMTMIARQRGTPVWMWAASLVALYWTASGIFTPERPNLWLSACAGFVFIAIANAWTAQKQQQPPFATLIALSKRQNPSQPAPYSTIAACALFFGLLVSMGKALRAQAQGFSPLPSQRRSPHRCGPVYKSSPPAPRSPP